MDPPLDESEILWKVDAEGNSALEVYFAGNRDRKASTMRKYIVNSLGTIFVLSLFLFIIMFVFSMAMKVYAEMNRKPKVLRREVIGEIIDARVVGGYRSSPVMEVRTPGRVITLSSTPSINIGADAWLIYWDNDRTSLEWTGSSASYYLQED